MASSVHAVSGVLPRHGTRASCVWKRFPISHPPAPAALRRGFHHRDATHASRLASGSNASASSVPIAESLGGESPVTRASYLAVSGGATLTGTAPVGGAKNAVLALLAGCLTCASPVTLTNVPCLNDVIAMCDVLRSVGAVVTSPVSGTVVVDASALTSHAPNPAAVQKLRASFFTAGPLLARTGRCEITSPGGCAIGTRPVDLHLQGFKQLGADVRVCAETDTIVMTTAKQLTGAGDIHFRFPSVGATHSVMCAASLAIGVTTIHGAAAEPEVTDLAAMLNKCGARITGAGTSTIRIEGVSGTCRSDTPSQGQQSLGVERTLRAETLSRTSMSQTSQTSSQSVNKLLYGQTVMKHVSVIPDLASLLGCHHRAIPDRVEAGTLLVAAAVTLSSISVTPVVLAHLKSTMQVLESSGCTFSSEPLCETGKGFQGDDRLARLTIYPPKVVLKSVTFATAPFPGIPTDMQPQLCVLCAVAAGVSVVTETVFENRFGHVKELGLMSAMFGEDEEFGGYENDDADDTDKKNAKRSIRGSNGAPLTPRDVTGQDLRATAALVLAGLVCGDHDVTNVYGVTHLDRGYEQLDAKLNALGARITRRG